MEQIQNRGPIERCSFDTQRADSFLDITHFIEAQLYRSATGARLHSRSLAQVADRFARFRQSSLEHEADHYADSERIRAHGQPRCPRIWLTAL